MSGRSNPSRTTWTRIGVIPIEASGGRLRKSALIRFFPILSEPGITRILRWNQILKVIVKFYSAETIDSFLRSPGGEKKRGVRMLPEIKYSLGAMVMALIAARPKFFTGYHFFPHPSVPRKTHRRFSSRRESVWFNNCLERSIRKFDSSRVVAFYPTESSWAKTTIPVTKRYLSSSYNSRITRAYELGSLTLTENSPAIQIAKIKQRDCSSRLFDVQLLLFFSFALKSSVKRSPYEPVSLITAT